MFKTYCNTTYTEYINTLRINKAKDMLLNTDITIEKVAERVGYNNINISIKI